MEIIGVLPLAPVVSDLSISGSSQYPVVYDDDVVTQVLDMIFGVTPGERFLIPDYGIDLEKYIFNYDSDTLQHIIISEVTRQLQKFAPFIAIEWTSSKVEQRDGIIDIRLTFKLAGSDDSKSYNRLFQSVS